MNQSQHQGFQQNSLNQNPIRETQRPVVSEVKQEEMTIKQNTSSSYIESDDMEIPTFLRRRR